MRKTPSELLKHAAVWLGVLLGLQTIFVLGGGLWLAISIMFLFVVFVEHWRAILGATVLMLSAYFLPAWLLYVECLAALLLFPGLFNWSDDLYSAAEYFLTKVAVAQVSFAFAQLGMPLTGITMSSVYMKHVASSESMFYYRRVRKALWAYYYEVRDQRNQLFTESQLFRYDKRMTDGLTERFRSRESSAA